MDDGPSAPTQPQLSTRGSLYAAEDVPRLFREFFRASNAKKRRLPGSGVGLSGAKAIVERFGGRMELDTRENEGATFTVRLPLTLDQL